MNPLDLEKFILAGKENGWVGSRSGGKKINATRKGSVDITYDDGEYHYHDSFVGFSDFIGMEHVCYKENPIWSMSYYGYLLDESFSGSDAIKVLEPALASLYSQGRFLGGHIYSLDDCEYRDMNFGDWQRFHGVEKIFKNKKLVYELMYFGGTVRK